MKASAAVMAAKERESRRPPHIFWLGPGAFTEAWSDRPREKIQVGMRRASADEYMSARAQAAKKTDELHPPLAGHHDHPTWQETYDVVMFHYLLGHVLTLPEDVTQKLWPHIQSGDMFMPGQVTPLGSDVVSIRFSREGIDRLFFELEVLSVKDSPVRREASDEEIVEMAEAVEQKTFFSSIALPPALPGKPELLPAEAKHKRARVEQQLRKLLAYVIDIHADGYEGAAGP